MKVVILAAGYGSRLRPPTDSIPKTMVPAAGERIIDRIIGAVQLASVSEAAVVLGYRGGEPRKYPQTQYAQSLRSTIVENPDCATNNIHSLVLIRGAQTGSQRGIWQRGRPQSDSSSDSISRP